MRHYVLLYHYCLAILPYECFTRVWCSKKEKNSLVDLAVAIIDHNYIDMRVMSEENKPLWHKAWPKRLDEYHLQSNML
ncbi:hypothetical protein D1007_52050 [Hordeum vulgare]|nr:hypothetical protein D1007_52050 [Hordeum vulgare]